MRNRIKDMREARALSLETLAEQVGAYSGRLDHPVLSILPLMEQRRWCCRQDPTTLRLVQTVTVL